MYLSPALIRINTVNIIANVINTSKLSMASDLCGSSESEESEEVNCFY